MAQSRVDRTAGCPDLTGRDDVLALLDDFYRDVLADDLLAPAFEAAGADVPAHLPVIADFWAGQLFGHGGYRGGLLRAHQRVHAEHPLSETHFARWLQLWNRTVDAGWSGPVAERAKAQAARIADAMCGRLPDPDDPDPAAPSRSALPLAAELPGDRRDLGARPPAPAADAGGTVQYR